VGGPNIDRNFRAAAHDCLCRDHRLPRASRGLRRTAFLSACLVLPLFAQQKPATKPAAARRVNELTLAGLRPGQDSLKKAQTNFGTKGMTSADDGVFWKCLDWTLRLDLENNKRIRGVILTADTSSKPTSNRIEELPATCLKMTSTALDLEQGKGFSFRKVWISGKGAKLGNSTRDLEHTYGPPDSKSPSTRDGQPLELWYYAFDWAGPDVPQVMEVLCTREQDGKPGRVVEITLAAPSL